MTFAQYGNIAALDFNSLAGGNPALGSGKLNSVWAIGNSSAGYGQTALANVSVDATIAASDWANLVSKTSNCNVHQTSGALSSVTMPASGSLISYQGNITTNLTTIYTNRLNSVSQGSTQATANTRSGTWSDALTFTHIASFANADAARFFFNAGGQLLISFTHPTGSAIDNIINALGTNMGTIVLSSPNAGSITAGGVAGYSGITKIGGTSTPAPSVLNTNSGYYGLANADVSVFQQDAPGTGGYLDTFVNITMKNNFSGAAGASGHYDNGNIITIYTKLDEVPNGLSVSSGTVCTLTVRPPETTNLANTWGTISVTGTNSAV